MKPRQIFASRLFAFVLLALALIAAHWPVLHLPYFWDEAGYYIPVAYDFFEHGELILYSTLSNAHLLLSSIYLALWWKLSAFKPAVTRIAMLLMAALALTAVFRLARLLTNVPVAVATLLCTAIFRFASTIIPETDVSPRRCHLGQVRSRRHSSVQR